MKTTALIAIMAIGPAVMIYSCNKANDQAIPQQNATNSTTTNHHVAGNKNSNPATMQWIESIKDCRTPAISCLPSATVKPKKVADLMAVVNSNPTAAGTAAFFNSPDGISCANSMGIGTQDLINLQSGGYRMIYTASGFVAGMVYFFFGPSQGLSTTNFQYVIPVVD